MRFFLSRSKMGNAATAAATSEAHILDDYIAALAPDEATLAAIPDQARP